MKGRILLVVLIGGFFNGCGTLKQAKEYANQKFDELKVEARSFANQKLEEAKTFAIGYVDEKLNAQPVILIALPP